MQQLVIVRPHQPEGYQAQALWLPEISAVAETEEQAIEKVRTQLANRLHSCRLVAVDIPVNAAVNPLAKLGGRSKDDPDFDLYLEEIERYRQDMEAKECSNSSSTPTT